MMMMMMTMMIKSYWTAISIALFPSVSLLCFPTMLICPVWPHQDQAVDSRSSDRSRAWRRQSVAHLHIDQLFQCFLELILHFHNRRPPRSSSLFQRSTTRLQKKYPQVEELLHLPRMASCCLLFVDLKKSQNALTERPLFTLNTCRRSAGFLRSSSGPIPSSFNLSHT